MTHYVIWYRREEDAEPFIREIKFAILVGRRSVTRNQIRQAIRHQMEQTLGPLADFKILGENMTLADWVISQARSEREEDT